MLARPVRHPVPPTGPDLTQRLIRIAPGLGCHHSPIRSFGPHFAQTLRAVGSARLSRASLEEFGGMVRDRFALSCRLRRPEAQITPG